MESRETGRFDTRTLNPTTTPMTARWALLGLLAIRLIPFARLACRHFLWVWEEESPLKRSMNWGGIGGFSISASYLVRTMAGLPAISVGKVGMVVELRREQAQTSLIGQRHWEWGE